MSKKRDWFVEWLDCKTTAVEGHSLILIDEQSKVPSDIIDLLVQTVRTHFVDPKITAKRLVELGAPKTAALLSEHLPTNKRARSGDLGEILATEIAEKQIAYSVPIRRLRWKDGRNMALRGDDIVGLTRDSKKKLQFLKGESKSRAALASSAIDEAAEALGRNRGRPSRHSVLFVAERLREQDQDKLALELEQAVLVSFSGHTVEHMLFTLTGSNPKTMLSDHLVACAKKKRLRHAIGFRIKDHAGFIGKLFGRL